MFYKMIEEFNKKKITEISNKYTNYVQKEGRNVDTINNEKRGQHNNLKEGWRKSINCREGKEK